MKGRHRVLCRAMYYGPFSESSCEDPAKSLTSSPKPDLEAHGTL